MRLKRTDRHTHTPLSTRSGTEPGKNQPREESSVTPCLELKKTPLRRRCQVPCTRLAGLLVKRRFLGWAICQLLLNHRSSSHNLVPPSRGVVDPFSATVSRSARCPGPERRDPSRWNSDARAALPVTQVLRMSATRDDFLDFLCESKSRRGLRTN